MLNWLKRRARGWFGAVSEEVAEAADWPRNENDLHAAAFVRACMECSGVARADAAV